MKKPKGVFFIIILSLYLFMCLNININCAYCGLSKVSNDSQSFKVFISNKPESVDQDGILFKEKLYPFKSIRLLYSHLNASPLFRHIWVKIINESNSPASLRIINAKSNPNIYAMKPGHQAALNFLTSLLDNKEEWIKVPPGSFVNLVSIKAAPREAVSGIIGMKLESDADVKVLVSTSCSTEEASLSKYIEEEFNPFRIHPHGVFSPANIVLEAIHTAGGADTEIVYGKGPWIIDKKTGLPNTGNYGVIYEINLNILNNEEEDYIADFYFEPLNGKSTGSFIIDNQVKESQILLPFESYLFYSRSVSAKVKIPVEIFTISEAGSCYPCKIIIKSKRFQEKKLQLEDKNETEND